MPRGVKRNAHQHNNRHENGIVAPGKRIAKQKSNGHLNGNADLRAGANTPPRSTSHPNIHVTPARNTAIDHDDAVVERKGGGGRITQEDHRASVAQFIHDDLDIQEREIDSMARISEQNPRQIDVNAARIHSLPETGTFHLALTVLKSCPLRDTLAILIFLLSLPPTFLTLTNAVFAILTFVPPSGSFSSFPSFGDITQGSPGAVSFTTMCMIDIVGLALWLAFFPPIQQLALTWAQAMVATTLGGGYSNRPGGSDSTLLCMSIVSATHLAGYKEHVITILRHTWASRWISISESFDSVPLVQTPPMPQDRSLYRNFKTLIALHIVCQGLARLIRRWIITARDNSKAPLSTKALDQEATIVAPATVEASGSTEPNSNPPSMPNELKGRGSLQSLREARDKISSGKRKRRQGNYVRSQQPLWAAFAATKATIMREYEQSQASTDAMGSKATGVENLGSAPFVREEGRIWVTLIQPNSFFFETSCFSSKNPRETDDREEIPWSDDTGIDQSNPFYVRIDGVDWTSMKVQILPSEDTGSGSRRRYRGEVYGLSPAYSYQVSFIGRDDDVVIHTDTIATPSSPITEQASVMPSGGTRSRRPSSAPSPITTHKTSIAALEAGLVEASLQQRKLRKESKAAAVTIKKDLDALGDKLNRVGSSDRGLNNRLLQQGQHMRQADDAITCIMHDLEIFGNVPDDETRQWKEQKAVGEKLRSDQSTIRDEMYRIKEANQGASHTLQTEALSTNQKRERLQHRTAKLTDQYSRLQMCTVQDLTEKERYQAERSARLVERRQLEVHYQQQIASLSVAFQESQFRSSNMLHQIYALESAIDQQTLLASQVALSHSRPMTPEGDLPGTHPSTSIPYTSSFRFPAFGSPEAGFKTLSNGPLAMNRTDALSGSNTRARSVSLLSGNSVYTDFSDQDPLSRMPTKNYGVEQMTRRQHSGSSESAPGSERGRGSPGVVGGKRGWGV